MDAGLMCVYVCVCACLCVYVCVCVNVCEFVFVVRACVRARVRANAAALRPLRFVKEGGVRGHGGAPIPLPTHRQKHCRGLCLCALRMDL